MQSIDADQHFLLHSMWKSFQLQKAIRLALHRFLINSKKVYTNVQYSIY